jgi:hypothetical protein
VLQDYLNSLPKEKRQREQMRFLNYLEKKQLKDTQNSQTINDQRVPKDYVTQFLAERTKIKPGSIKDEVLKVQAREQPEITSSEEYETPSIDKNKLYSFESIEMHDKIKKGLPKN